MPGLLSASGIFAQARIDDPLWIAGQLFGLCAVVLTFISYQYKSPKKLLLIQTAGTAANAQAPRVSVGTAGTAGTAETALPVT